MLAGRRLRTPTANVNGSRPRDYTLPPQLDGFKLKFKFNFR